MFGLGKLVSGLTGGLLDKVGLGFLKPFVSLAVDFFTGNYAAMIGDIADLVGQFTNSDFLKNLSQFQPLGDFGQGMLGGCFGDVLSSFTNNIDALRGTAQLLGLDKADKMLDLIGDFSSSMNMIQQNRETAHYARLF